MSKCLSVLGFETMEDRVVFSASVGGMDSGSLPDMEQDLVQEVQPLNRADRDRKDWIDLSNISNSLSRHKPLLIIAEDLEGNALNPDSTAIKDGLSNTIMIGEMIG